MGTYTTNYNLFMPTVGETGWGTLVNGNFTTIDTTMAKLNTRITALESVVQVDGNRNVTFPASVTLKIKVIPKLSGVTPFINIINEQSKTYSEGYGNIWYRGATMTLTTDLFIFDSFTATWTVGSGYSGSTNYPPTAGTRLINVDSGEVLLSAYGTVQTNGITNSDSGSITMKYGETYAVEYIRVGSGSTVKIIHTCTCGTGALYL